LQYFAAFAVIAVVLIVGWFLPTDGDDSNPF
jgi:hypothetical protein